MDNVMMIGRLLVSLAAVLGVMWVIARRMKKGRGPKSSQLIDVLGRQQLSRSASLAVVRVGEQALVIGVTDAQVSVLGETDLGAAQAMITAATDSRRSTAPRRSPASTSHRAAPTAPPIAISTAVATDAIPDSAPAKSRALSGSALSPHTWRQTIDSLRDLTTRQA